MILLLKKRKHGATEVGQFISERDPTGSLVVEFITKGNWPAEERLNVKLLLEREENR
jgi:hypothetical protein